MKSHKSAVVLIPPERVWPQIQKIRKKYDKVFHRWMPHINLLYPFKEFSKSEFLEAQGLFEEALASVKPFSVAFTIDSFGKFIHGKNATVWLKPIVKGPVKPNMPKPVKPVITANLSVGGPHPSFSQISVTGYTPPCTNQSTSAKTGFDALKDAVWCPDSDISNKVTIEPSLDNLRFAFIGDDHDMKSKAGVDLGSKNMETDSSKVPYVKKHEEDETDRNISFIYSHDDEISNNIRSPNQVHHVQSLLQSVFPEYDDLVAMSEEGYQPHLTVGQCHAHTVDEFIRGLQDSWMDVEFEVQEVCLIHRGEGADCPFEVDYRVQLGGGASVTSSMARELTAPPSGTDIPTEPPQKVEHPIHPDICSGFPLVEEPKTWQRTDISENQWMVEDSLDQYKVPDGTYSYDATSNNWVQESKPKRPSYTPKQRAPNIKSKHDFPPLNSGKPKVPAGFEKVGGKKKGKKQ